MLELLKSRIKFNRNELSGAFGDIGTDLPLIIGMLLATDLEISNTLIVFGVLQMLTAVIYGIPMPVQPLKAVALIVITQNISADVIWGGGLAIGLFMLILSLTGLLTWLSRVIPKAVIRGIQLGLGLQLCLLAIKDYIPSDGYIGFIFAAVAFTIGMILLGNKKYPPAIFIILLGLIYTAAFNFEILAGIGFSLPTFTMPDIKSQSIITGFIVLALPQIPLSLGNSIFATNQIAKDYFPEKKITVKKIGITYSVMNLLAPLLGGIPVCHGSGGIAGHYTFGGRTGGSAFIYGLIFIGLGLFFSGNTPESLMLFPKPILGVILLFEGFALIVLIKDIASEKSLLLISIVVAICAVGLPGGYIIGMITGILIYYFREKIFLSKY
ncbi:MAG: putative sulfate/molybdate transporter [Bacteroidetes bacterium]|nr:putative sulfate/molybdate transporter [Bacteroidota bacterium]